jgi:6-phosphogluconolactonase
MRAGSGITNTAWGVEQIRVILRLYAVTVHWVGLRSRMRYWLCVPLAGLMMLSGCGKFFPPVTSGSGSSGSGTGTGGASGDYLYVSNSDLNTVAGFSIASGKLAVTANSPYTIGTNATQAAIAITPNNKFLFLANFIDGAIYGFAINSDGSLSTIGDGGALVTGVFPLAMKVDSTSNWLIMADVSSTTEVFGINSSTGALSVVSNTQLGLTAGTPERIVFNPADNLVFVALGTGGVNVLNFNSSTGAISANQQLQPGQSNGTAFSDTSLAVSPNGNFLFVTETGGTGVKVLSIASSGVLSAAAGSPVATGLGPNDVLVDSTGAYLYVANRTDGTISAFSLASTTGKLTAITGSPFATGSEPSSLAEDNTHAYIAVACTGGTPDLQVFAIDAATPGALDAFATATTGTDPTGAFQVVASN